MFVSAKTRENSKHDGKALALKRVMRVVLCERILMKQCASSSKREVDGYERYEERDCWHYRWLMKPTSSRQLIGSVITRKK